MKKLYYLRKPISLSPIQKLIKDSKEDYDDIVVIFDYDQTLTQKDGVKGSARGGEKSIRFLNWLNDNKIKWYVNTARGAGAVAAIATSMKNFKIPFSPILIDQTQRVCLSPKPGVGFIGEQTKHDGVEIGMCNNIISAGYDKDISTDYILSKLKNKPKLLIFVDDNSTNILNLYRYFDNKPSIDFYGVIYEPYKDAEEDHEATMAIFHEEVESMETKRGEHFPDIEHINEEYNNSSGGRRKKTQKSNSRSRLRKSRKV